jgi:hypothetical protein
MAIDDRSDQSTVHDSLECCMRWPRIENGKRIDAHKAGLYLDALFIEAPQS